MNSKIVTTNIAFIILICLLLLSAVKAQKTPLNLFDSLSDIQASKAVEEETTGIILKDFDEIRQPEKVNKTIDRATAMNYVQSRPLNGTEMLALTKVKKISPYLNKNKKVVIYVNKGSDKNIQAFMDEFAKSRVKYSSNPNYVFIPLETLWDLNEEDIRNTHDRVVYNLKQDCGLFCILDLQSEKLIKLKGSQVSKKSAEIVGVILNSM